MHEDFYNIQKIYEDYTSTMQGNYPSINSASAPGSYDPPMANGPGNGPVRVQGGSPSTGDLMHFDKKTSPQTVLSHLEDMLKVALNQAKEKQMSYAVELLKPIYTFIRDVDLNR